MMSNFSFLSRSVAFVCVWGAWAPQGSVSSCRVKLGSIGEISVSVWDDCPKCGSGQAQTVHDQLEDSSLLGILPPRVKD